MPGLKRVRHSRFPFVSRFALLLLLGVLGGSVTEARLINHVIHVSVDGLRPDAVTLLGPTNVPNFYRLRTEGAFTDNARTDYDYTETLPNHTSQLTGRGVTGALGHGWTENVDPAPDETLASNKGSYVAGVFDVVHDNGWRTGEYASKSKFLLYATSWNEMHGGLDGTSPDHGRDKIDVVVIMRDTLPLAKALAAGMKTQAIHYAFLHLADPDSIGHGNAWEPTPGSPYSEAVKAMDSRLGVLLDLATTNAQFAGRTVIIVTADHGGIGSAHANAGVVENYTVPFYIWGPGVTPGANLYSLNAGRRLDPGTGRPTYGAAVQPIRNGEAANLALKLLGLPPVPGSTINPLQDLAWSTNTSPGPPAPVASGATSVTNCSFTANWNSVSGAQGYLLDVSTNSAFTSFVGGYENIVVGNVLSFSVTGLKASTTHYYRVSAYNENGTSPNSGTISATTSANATAPNAPVVAAAKDTGSASFTAAWVAGCGATGYRLDVSTSSDFGNFVAGCQDLDVGNETSRAVVGLSGSTTYFYRVQAYNGLGSSGNSGTTNVTTLDVNFCIPRLPLGHGNMEDSNPIEYSVCPDWTGYSAGAGAASWAKEKTIVHGGAAAQRAKNINPDLGAYVGVYQTVEANPGDAFTFEGWVYPESNPAYAQASMVARWDGVSEDPDETASWRITGAPRLTWTHVQDFSGNATGDAVTLFLDSRLKSGSVAITAYWDDVVCFHAYVPPQPTLSAASSTAINVDVNAGCNSTNPAAQFAVSIGGGAYALGTHWVQANGTITTTPAWQTDASWTTKTVSGLMAETAYTFKTMARYSASVTQATYFGAGASLSSQEPPPLPPTITQQPSNQSVAAGGTVNFTVGATGSGTLYFQWQTNQTNVNNGGHYSGCTTSNLTITGVDAGDVAGYRCVVTNAHGSTNSVAATLTLVANCNAVNLVNGNFESGNTAGVANGWTAYEVNGPTIKVWSIQTASAPQGSQYQQIQAYNDAHTAGAGVRQNITACVIGATYQIAGWFRSNSALGRARVRVSPTASTSWNTAVDLNPVADFGSGTTWSAFSGTVVATGTNMTLWLDGRTISGTSGKVGCFDAVTVTCLGPPTPLRFESVAFSAPNQINLRLSGPAGSNVTIQSSSNLAGWTTLTNLPNPGGAVQFTHPVSGNATRLFYRATSP